MAPLVRGRHQALLDRDALQRTPRGRRLDAVDPAPPCVIWHVAGRVRLGRLPGRRDLGDRASSKRREPVTDLLEYARWQPVAQQLLEQRVVRVLVREGRALLVERGHRRGGWKRESGKSERCDQAYWVSEAGARRAGG